ncbi:MAG: hypothetical protein PHT69_03870 [Bacteroidales bacterium]|nr:hypothetical protein [Bacteroidales bacterium]
MALFLLLLQNYFIFFSFILITALLGFTIWHLLPIKKNDPKSVLSLFYSLLFGICVIVVFFSLFITNFKTINISLIFLGILLIAKYFRKDSINYKENYSKITDFAKNHTIRILIFSLPFFLFEAFYFFNNEDFHYIIPFVDYIDMHNISQVITQTGQENNKYLLTNFYYPQFHGIAPYHFFELWLNGFLSYFLPLPGTLTLMLFVYPFFYFTSFIGLIAIWEQYGKLNLFKYILSLIILITGGMYFKFYNNFQILEFYGGNVGNLMHIWGKKSAVLYPFIIAAYLSMAMKEYILSLAFWLCLGVIAIGVLPGIAGGIFIFIITNFIHKSFSKKEYKTAILLYLIFIPFFGSLYFLWGNKNEESLGFSTIIYDVITALDYDFIKVIFFRTIFPVLRMVIIFSPFLLFIIYVLWQVKKNDKSSYKLLIQFSLINFFILTVGSITGGIASINIFSGGQFFTYLFPIFIVLTIYSFILFFSSFQLKPLNFTKVIAVLFFIFFILSCSYNIYNNFNLQNHYKNQSLKMYDSDYLKEITEYLNNNSINPLGVSFIGQNDIIKYPLNAYGITGLTFTGLSIKLTKNFHATSNLSIFDLSIDTTDRFSSALFKSFEFYNFVRDQKLSNNFISYDVSQADFINYFNIDYALVYKDGKLPETISRKIIKHITDPVSGQQFIVFEKLR